MVSLSPFFIGILWNYLLGVNGAAVHISKMKWINPGNMYIFKQKKNTLILSVSIIEAKRISGSQNYQKLSLYQELCTKASSTWYTSTLKCQFLHQEKENSSSILHGCVML